MTLTQWSNRHPLLSCFLVIVGFAALVPVFQLAPEPTPPKEKATATAPRVDTSGAYVCAQQLVESRLKAPRTAKFPWGVSDDAVTYTGGTDYIVSAYVDSQNGFGAMIRTTFACNVTYTGKPYSCGGICFFDE